MCRPVNLSSCRTKVSANQQMSSSEFGPSFWLTSRRRSRQFTCLSPEFKMYEKMCMINDKSVNHHVEHLNWNFLTGFCSCFVFIHIPLFGAFAARSQGIRRAGLEGKTEELHAPASLHGHEGAWNFFSFKVIFFEEVRRCFVKCFWKDAISRFHLTNHAIDLFQRSSVAGAAWHRDGRVRPDKKHTFENSALRPMSPGTALAPDVSSGLRHVPPVLRASQDSDKIWFCFYFPHLFTFFWWCFWFLIRFAVFHGVGRLEKPSQDATTEDVDGPVEIQRSPRPPVPEKLKSDQEEVFPEVGDSSPWQFSNCFLNLKGWSVASS